MSYGRYSDDTLEDSVLRDDELHIQEELDKEIHQNGSGNNGSWVGPVVMIIIVIAFLLWFFIG